MLAERGMGSEMTGETARKILEKAIVALPESPSYDKQAAVRALRRIEPFPATGNDRRPSDILLGAFDWATNYPDIPWRDIFVALVDQEDGGGGPGGPLWDMMVAEAVR